MIYSIMQVDFGDGCANRLRYPDYMELRGQFVPAALEKEVNSLLQRKSKKLEALQYLHDEENTLRDYMK
jgi:hypothetical protein